MPSRVAAKLRLEQVAERVHELRLPIPWEDEFVNCFLFVDGAMVDLVDCGIGSEESIAMIHRAIVDVAGTGARLRRLVITHIHPDHFGAAGVLASQGGVEVFMHRLEVPLVHPRYLALEELIAEVGRHLRVNGVPEPDAEALQNASRSLRDFVVPTEAAIQLDGAETLELGGRRLRVEWTPGHSPGHICLFDAEERLLFAGDQLLPEISPNVGLHPQSTPNPLGDFLASLDRLVDLGPERVLPAHGRPFRDVAPLAARLRAHHARRKDQITRLVADREMSGWEVAVRLWGERSHLWEKRLALQEALAHLQDLAVEGRVEKLVSRTAVRWRAAPEWKGD
jgi:glyoxylase-like metal-dependent hydrolase (beta-lactamase superfamily II)